MTRPSALVPGQSSALAAVAPWRADRGDGTYRNPIIFADYSDPDAIRVGEDYWLTASSFSHAPGLPILHSRDLVNWAIVNHALPRLVPEAHFSTPRHGQGVWAPSIRHHAGKFWIFYPDPDFGLYVVTADDPRGRWSDPVLIKAGKGLIDPCPFWDADGSAYLIHGWAKSRSGIKNRLTLHRLRADSLGVIDEGVVIIDGDRMPGWNTIEGPKLYRRGDYYYVFAPAGGVTDGYQAVFRARDPYGPYEHRITLARGRTAINGPHQGAWLDTPHGTDCFLHFQELPAYGRVVHLQPMRWENDWPVMGREPDQNGTGEPVLTAPNPHGRSARPLTPAASDEFELPELGRQWQWQANPAPGWTTLETRPGFLRFACVPHPANETLWSAPHLLLQKFPGPQFVATTRLEFEPSHDGDTAGLIVFGFDYQWIGLRREGARLALVCRHCANAHQGGTEIELANLPAATPLVDLRVSVDATARCQFAFSTDGTRFTDAGPTLQARSSFWVGAKVGVFAQSPAAGGGHADFDWFRLGALAS